MSGSILRYFFISILAALGHTLTYSLTVSLCSELMSMNYDNRATVQILQHQH